MTLDDFVRKHARFLGSLFFLAAGIIAAGYSVGYTTMVQRAEELKTASGQIVEENKRLEERVAERAEGEREQEQGISYLPAFLERINQLAHINDVIIRRMTPDEENPFKFHIEFITDYYTFVRFSSALESLDVILNDLQVHENDRGQTPPLHAIAFSIVARNNAETLSGERLASLQGWVAERDRRNPFQRFAFAPNRERPTPLINLTWIHRLGAIGMTPEGARYATIDRRNYIVGEKLGDRIITEIQVDQVLLEKETNDGRAEYLLGFRRQGAGTSPTPNRGALGGGAGGPAAGVPGGGLQRVLTNASGR